MYARRLSPRSASPPRPHHNGVTLYDAPVYPHTSTFKSNNLELTIRSPRARYVEDSRYVGHLIPIFGGKDSVGGTVTAIVPHVVPSAYELVISIEGAFFWIGPQKEVPQSLPLASPLPKRIKHVFLSSSVAVPLVIPPAGSPKRHVSLRSALRKTILRSSLSRARRQGAGATHDSRGSPGATVNKTFHSFTFQLPAPTNHEIPGTISVSRLQSGGLRGRWYAEGAQVAYKVTAQLRSNNLADEEEMYGQLEAPVCIESEMLGGDTTPPTVVWSQSALTSIKTVPVRCLLFLPQSTSFSRSDAIPFCISFITSPESLPLAQQITKDAIIRVTLVRVLRMDSTLAFPAPIPRTRRSEEGPSPASPQREHQDNILRRVTTNASGLFGWSRKRRAKPNAYPTPDMTDRTQEDKLPSGLAHEKPLPPLPQGSVKLYEDVICSATSEGFKKCITRRSTRSSLPRWNTSHNHDGVLAPDGFFKGELQLSNELSNTIDWPGLSLTYFVEAIVIFGVHELKTRHVVRIVEPYREIST